MAPQRKYAGAVATLAAAAAVVMIAQPRAHQDQLRPFFRAGTAIVSVDVVVRDESGTLVRGLTPADFTILEDGRPQQIQTFSFEEISDRPLAPRDSVNVLAGVEERLREEVQRVAGAPAHRHPCRQQDRRSPAAVRSCCCSTSARCSRRRCSARSSRR